MGVYAWRLAVWGSAVWGSAVGFGRGGFGVVVSAVERAVLGVLVLCSCCCRGNARAL